MMSPHCRTVSSARGHDAVAPRRSRRRAGASALDVWLARVPAHDELVVVVTHQTIELWFNQLLCELGVLVVDLDGDNVQAASRTLERAGRIAALLAEQTGALAGLPQAERDDLGALLGGGLEHDLLRRLQLLAGSGAAAFGRWLARERRPERPRSASVREAFVRAVVRHHDPADPRLPGLSPTASEEELSVWLAAQLARPERAAQRELSASLRALDEQLVAWVRLRHGLRRGRRGAAGRVQPVVQRAGFFPELWLEPLASVTGTVST